jgi:hypothetical protein
VGCTAEELDTSELIAGERNERSTNLVRGDPQKHLMLSMTLAQRAEVVWHKILFIYNSNSHESQSTNQRQNIPNQSELFSSPVIPGCSSKSSTTSQSPTTASFIASISRCTHRLRTLGGVLSSLSFDGESHLSFSDMVGEAVAPKLVPLR